MPMLIGSTTLLCTILSVALGQITMGMEAFGAIHDRSVLMSVKREES